MDVRQLGESDAADFKRLFRDGLVAHPEAFSMGLEELDAQPLETLTHAITAPDNRFYGAFESDRLIGMVSFQRYTRLKLRQRAVIGSMYVIPEARGRGIGQKLLEQVLQTAQAWGDGLEDVVLGVTVGNDAARRLYERVGFQTYSIDPRFLKVNDRYFDIEWMIYAISSAD